MELKETKYIIKSESDGDGGGLYRRLEINEVSIFNRLSTRLLKLASSSGHLIEPKVVTILNNILESRLNPGVDYSKTLWVTKVDEYHGSRDYPQCIFGIYVSHGELSISCEGDFYPYDYPYDVENSRKEPEVKELFEFLDRYFPRT